MTGRSAKAVRESRSDPVGGSSKFPLCVVTFRDIINLTTVLYYWGNCLSTGRSAKSAKWREDRSVSPDIEHQRWFVRVSHYHRLSFHSPFYDCPLLLNRPLQNRVYCKKSDLWTQTSEVILYCWTEHLNMIRVTCKKWWDSQICHHKRQRWQLLFVRFSFLFFRFTVCHFFFFFTLFILFFFL
jgi:hypothetical protein